MLKKIKNTVNKNEEIEERIEMDIIVDAYEEEEKAIGWYNYLQDKMNFPITAICIKERSISPLITGDEVEIISMAKETDCMHEMFVMIRWDRKKDLGVPLSQLKPISETDKDSLQAIDDWHYWVNRGYVL